MGRDHPEVAITLTKLANAHGSLGAAAKQRDLLDRARAIREREPSCGGLSGDCCPAAEGVFLECCGGGWRRLSETTGRSFALTLGDGARWLLFASADVSLAKAGASWRLRAPTDVVVRLAYAPDRASEELLVAHAGTYAVGGRVSWAARGDAAVMRFRWATRTFDGAPLLGLATSRAARS